MSLKDNMTNEELVNLLEYPAQPWTDAITGDCYINLGSNSLMMYNTSDRVWSKVGKADITLSYLYREYLKEHESQAGTPRFMQIADEL